LVLRGKGDHGCVLALGDKLLLPRSGCDGCHSCLCVLGLRLCEGELLDEDDLAVLELLREDRRERCDAHLLVDLYGVVLLRTRTVRGTTTDPDRRTAGAVT